MIPSKTPCLALLVVCSSLGLVACTGSVLGPASSLSGGSAGTGAGPAGGGAPAGGGDPIVGGEPSVCTQDEPAQKRIWRLSREQYANTLAASFGDVASIKSTILALPADGVVEGYDNNAKSLFIGGELTELVRANAERLAPLNAEGAVKANACLKATPVSDACLKQVTLSLGQRAFRRPLYDDEGQRYFDFVKAESQASSATTAVELYVQFLLRSPQFLYRSELGEVGASGANGTALTPFESASRLAYSLTNRPPDETLMNAAAAGELATEAQRREQASRLLASEFSQQKVRDFVLQYLGVKSQQGSAPGKDGNEVPDFATNLYADLVSETSQFIDDIAAQPGARFDSLFASRQTYVNERLAQFYGLAPANPPLKGFVKVDLSAKGRRGVLTQGLFLSTHAGAASTKHRGRAYFVFRNMMCLNPGRPPPGATMAGEAIAASAPVGTKRDGYEYFLKVAGNECKACHRRFEPIGLAFETFDHFGRAREMENGFSIDTRSELVGAPAEFASFADAADFSEIFSRSALAQNCFVAHAFTSPSGERLTH
jgi:Protein of unknown function (DUF1592)/Protein of unknown function (DUF1588)/Protein of unknown function (DUF1595)/Protein of unknown function (DUF1587)